jgi:hypothetical protein
MPYQTPSASQYTQLKRGQASQTANLNADPLKFRAPNSYSVRQQGINTKFGSNALVSSKFVKPSILSDRFHMTQNTISAYVDEVQFTGTLTVNWGDGVFETFDQTHTGYSFQHNYSMSGLHSFTMSVSSGGTITKIRAYENSDITALDVTNCHNLQYLRCDYVSITSLDVSNCPLLTYLNCNRCGIITTLDVTNCPLLTYLACGYCGLSSLDVTNCNLLTSLECWSNQISSLNLSNCSLLTILQCDENNLTSLNLSGCTLLDTVSCQYNNLTSLNVTGCSLLRILTCSNTLVTNLDLRPCTALISADVSNNTSLVSLNVSYLSNLGSLNILNNTSLTNINIERSGLTRSHVTSNVITSLNPAINGIMYLNYGQYTSTFQIALPNWTFNQV